MTTTYKLIPSSISALLYVQGPNDSRLLPPPCVYISEEKGVVYGQRDVPLDKSGLPEQVQEAIRAHFKYVFDLEHENWKQPGPSPRAEYCDQAKPWEIRIDDNT